MGKADKIIRPTPGYFRVVLVDGQKFYLKEIKVIRILGEQVVVGIEIDREMEEVGRKGQRLRVTSKSLIKDLIPQDQDCFYGILMDQKKGG